MSSKLPAYNDLAWTEPIVSSPDDHKEETEYLVKLIKENSQIEVKTLLHLGCGAGINDFTFKRHFKVTGLDISDKMLAMARLQNPEIQYVCCDMRSVSLNACFDAIAIPDSIGYLTKPDDLRATMINACGHLNPGGVLLIVALVKEDFQENNFVYNGSKDNIDITVFENNYIADAGREAYEATIVHLIRRNGKLSVFSECHTCGLFTLGTWASIIDYAGLQMKQEIMENSYDRFLQGEGKYTLRVFVGVKPL